MDYPKQWPTVVVVWEDHTASCNWKTPKEVAESKPAQVTTIGFLVHEDRKTMKVCQCVTSDGDVGNESLILKRDVVSRYELELV